MDTLALILIVATVLVAGLGSLTQIFPGNGLLVVGTLVWAISTGGVTWWIFAGVVAIVALSMVIKYIVPLRHMKRKDVANSTIVIGAIAGVIGFFVIPVIGLPIGFVLGIYLAEASKNRSTAWAKTKAALTGVAASILIEVIATALAGGLWIAGHFIVT